jgi:hypothetical protein
MTTWRADASPNFFKRRKKVKLPIRMQARITAITTFNGRLSK